ncbi:MAG: FtsX-like permease family protein, partial [Cyclobacteriaceae bacterium]|nr:FtsX-like permease family protein [Cyclobacteriaceae bacterium]
ESIIINEEFVKEFNWRNPLGKKVVWNDSVSLYVVGVVRDFYTFGFWNSVNPVMFRLNKPEDIRTIIVKSDAKNYFDVSKDMEKNFKALFPNRLYNPDIMDEQLIQMADTNYNVVYIFTFLGVIALILTTTGLYSLVSLNIIKRTKEIGIRRVLGAPVYSIMKKLNKEFIILLILATIAGIPLGNFISDKLFNIIWSYYKPPSPLIIAIAIAVIVIVAASTLIYKVYRAALSNPINNLRTE